MGDEPTYQVREAAPADLAALLGVLAENQSTPLREASEASGSTSPRQAAMWNRMMNTADLTVYLAELGNDVVGTACMLVLPHVTYDCQPTALIEAMVVKYAHRRRGVARLLLHRALEDARTASCRKVELLSHKRHADDGAHQLYRAVGFEAEAEGFRLYLDSDDGRTTRSEPGANPSSTTITQ